jgi:hypothetical protein
MIVNPARSPRLSLASDQSYQFENISANADYNCPCQTINNRIGFNKQYRESFFIMVEMNSRYLIRLRLII